MSIQNSTKFSNIIEKLDEYKYVLLVFDFNERLYAIFYVQYPMYVSDLIYCV